MSDPLNDLIERQNREIERLDKEITKREATLGKLRDEIMERGKVGVANASGLIKISDEVCQFMARNSERLSLELIQLKEITNAAILELKITRAALAKEVEGITGLLTVCSKFACATAETASHIQAASNFLNAMAQLEESGDLEKLRRLFNGIQASN
jgi:hypothetical protein